MIFEYNIEKEVEGKFKRGNQLLFNRDSECLMPLISLIEKQKHRTLVAWAFDCLLPVVSLFEEKYREERRLSVCMEVCKDWARGEVKMAVAKMAILDAHKVAGELADKPYGLLAHSVGQGCSTVHVETHGLGLVFYELSALVYLYGLDRCNSIVNKKLEFYYEKLKYWESHIDELEVQWASFLLDDRRVNKEKLLNDRRKGLGS